MPTYEYSCKTHGVMRLRKPMAEAGRAEVCECGLPLRRVWSVPNLITRPWGYHLDPHHPDYWKLDRMQEMGHVPTPDERSNLGAGAPTEAELDAEEYAGVRLPEPSPDEMQKLSEVARATFSESGSRL